MGLYINQNHSSIYKTKKNLSEPNQNVFIKNHTAEMIEEQKRINKTLEKSFHGLKHLYEVQEHTQSNKWNEFSKQLTELKGMKDKQEIFEKNMIEQLKKLEAENTKMQTFMKENRLSETEIKEEITKLNSAQQTITNQLQEYGNANNQIMDKMDQQITMQQQMAEQMTLQEQKSQDVIQRLDEQEALSEKITRQLDHFRSILFERTNFLSDKIEGVSTFVLNAISRSDELQKNMIMVQKQKDKANK